MRIGRRAVLGMVGATGVSGVAALVIGVTEGGGGGTDGGSGTGGRGPKDTDADDGGGAQPGGCTGETVCVTVTVVDADGDPIPGEPVRLRDTGGSLDVRDGTTGPDGRVRFEEGVGPSPCNDLYLSFPDREVDELFLGCENGGATVSRRVVLDG